MAFDLAKAAGLDKIVPNLDTMEVVQIPLDKIDPNEKNFFAVDDVQDLVDSIQINGILQPLLLKTNGDRYTIIAGHRRRRACGAENGSCCGTAEHERGHGVVYAH